MLGHAYGLGGRYVFAQVTRANPPRLLRAYRPNYSRSKPFRTAQTTNSCFVAIPSLS